jgi:hypothetical protein
MASDLTTGVFFYVRVLDEKPLALFRLDVDTDRKEINETIWDGSSWQETDRLTMYIGYGSTEVEQILERDATLAFPDAFRDKAPNFKRIIPSVMSKHLQGKHDQRTHGGGGGMGAPRDTAHAKQKQAWELHEQGKTWEEVAKEAGYANGGAARLAGKAHEKRMKAKGDGADIPKPPEVVTPKPKTDKEGAKAIKDAQAIVDKATGGRPVRDVLADERNGNTSLEPTAKEKEVTEAVIKSGAILRGEVERRRDVIGKEVVDTAKADIEVLNKDREFTQKRVDEVSAQRKEVRDQIHKEVMKSPEMDEALNEQIDRRLNYTRNETLTAVVEADRSVAINDMREYADLYASDMPYQKRAEWVEERAKERFPTDKKAQKAYEEIVETSTWAGSNAERQLEKRDEKVAKLSQEDKRRAKSEGEAYQDLHALNGQIADRQTLIKNGGVTPEQNAEIVRSVLADSGRTMTSKPSQPIKGTKKVVAELRTELEKIPDELWNDSQYPNLNVTAGSGRGHWSSYNSRIKTDGSGGRRASTLLHEATHAVEDMNPSVKQLEFVMSHRRAKGMKPEKLSKLSPRSGYRKNEEAIEDAWANPYAGKSYGSGRRASREIMTMGIESLYKRNFYPSDVADEDHLNFVMGVLAHA